jgi:hypothetical protein
VEPDVAPDVVLEGLESLELLDSPELPLADAEEASFSRARLRVP